LFYNNVQKASKLLAAGASPRPHRGRLQVYNAHPGPLACSDGTGCPRSKTLPRCQPFALQATPNEGP